MQPPHQELRVNLVQLKAKIVTRLGPERSKQYFYYLNRLLALRLTKVEFNKLCFRILGKENILLHNKLISSILRNAYQSNLPPAINDEEVPKSTLIKALNQPVFLNGNALSLLPKKVRSAIHDTKIGDCPAVVLNGKVDFASHQFAGTGNSNFSKILENGHFTHIDIQKQLQHRRELIEQSKNDEEVSFHHTDKVALIKTPPDGPVSVNSKDQNDLVAKGVKEVPSRSLLHAPLGVPFFSVGVGGARKSLTLVSSVRSVTETLWERMQQIATIHGLKGISMDSANLLNNGLDIYLKGLIRSCMDMVGARYGHDMMKNSSNKQQSGGKLVGDLWLGHPYQVPSSHRTVEGVQERRFSCPVSLLDFKVAMELNPQQLGEDWPLLLEKLSMGLFEQ